MANFNPNEVILERVRSMIFTAIEDGKVIGRLSQLEDPSLQTSAEGDDVVDATGATITTIYKAKKGQFTASNSLFSIDLAALQFGTEKVVGTSEDKITQQAEQQLKIVDGKVTLSHKPSNEIKYVYAFDNNAFGEEFVSDVAPAEGGDQKDGTFSIKDNVITLPKNTKGTVYVQYEYETENAVQITNNSNKYPEDVGCTMFVSFKSVCNANLIYYGTIRAERAKLDPTQVELALTSTGKHAFTVNFMKEYCETDADLFSIVISED